MHSADLCDVLVDPRDRALFPAFAQPAEEAQKKLQGTWTATKAERDGKAADDVVGHRLSFTGNRFQIQSKDGKRLYAGTVRVNPSAKPAAIDFEHTEGALKGTAMGDAEAVRHATAALRMPIAWKERDVRVCSLAECGHRSVARRCRSLVLRCGVTMGSSERRTAPLSPIQRRGCTRATA